MIINLSIISINITRHFAKFLLLLFAFFSKYLGIATADNMVFTFSPPWEKFMMKNSRENIDDLIPCGFLSSGVFGLPVHEKIG